jgi:1-acyl-sn-glycerol-3-phosphate acyltransferase
MTANTPFTPPPTGRGAWLHIFPEGRVTPDGSVGPFRQGIGKLLCEARAAAGGRCERRCVLAAVVHTGPSGGLAPAPCPCLCDPPPPPP